MCTLLKPLSILIPYLTNPIESIAILNPLETTCGPALGQASPALPIHYLLIEALRISAAAISLGVLHVNFVHKKPRRSLDALASLFGKVSPSHREAACELSRLCRPPTTMVPAGSVVVGSTSICLLASWACQAASCFKMASEGRGRAEFEWLAAKPITCAPFLRAFCIIQNLLLHNAHLGQHAALQA